jgi:AraC family transcriptional regulator
MEQRHQMEIETNVSRLRLENAMKEIAAGNLSLAQVAFNAGFSSPASFTRAVLQLSGSTPRDRTNSLALDQFSLILGAHVLKTHAGLPRLGGTKRGGLAPWQEKRAAEMIRARLDGKLRLSDLARECGLSVSHFTRAFRKSFGKSPYRWLLERRIDRAKVLLVTGDPPIADVAIRSGFSDQTAFTRAFGRMVGDSPGRWRRVLTSRARSG